VKVDRISLALSSPQLAIVGGGILSALTTFLPTVLLYFGLSIHYVFQLFTALYLISIPPLAASAYNLYKLNSTLSTYCETQIVFPKATFVSVLLPLGYVPALQTILVQLSRCDRFKGMIRISPVDLLWNILTAGAYSLTYAILVNRVINLLLRGGE
jgi:hypothetical protein